MHKAQFKKMLELQTMFNQKIDPDWPLKPKVKREDAVAIIVEFGEFHDHLGYKWWKKQEADFDQAAMELVDIFHFAMSATIEHGVKGKEDLNKSFETISEKLNCHWERAIDGQGSIKFGPGELTEHIVDGVPDPHFYLILFSLVIEFYGDFETFYGMYMGKNALNFVRQERGYKEGSYRKVWNGHEDNEVMIAVVESMALRIANEDKPMEFIKKTLLEHYDAEVAGQDQTVESYGRGKKIDINELNSRIAEVEYTIVPKTTMTICIIKMKSGFSVEGDSSCVDPDDFNEEMGREIAYENAFDKLCTAEAYRVMES